MNRFIAAETLAYYQNFSSRDARLDRQRGAEDGYRELPAVEDTDFSPHEAYRIAEARTALNEYIRRMRTEIDKIDLRIREFVSLRDDDYSSRKSSLYVEKQSRLQRVNDLVGKGSHRYTELVRQRDEANRTYREREHEFGRAPSLRMHEPIIDRPWFSWLSIYILVLLFLALLEVPVNQLAVQLSFEFSAWISYIIAFLIGVTFILQAHFLGVQMLRFIAVSGWRKLWHLVLILLTLLLMATMILVLFQMRGEVTATVAAQSAIIQVPGATPPPEIAQVGASNFFSNLFGNLSNALFGDPTESNFAQVGLLLLNGLVLLIGTVLSCLRHDREPELEQAYLKKRQTERAVDYYMRDFNRDASDIENEMSKRISSAERLADQIDQDIQKLEEERMQLKRQIENDIRTVLNILSQQLTAYQESNAQSRKSQRPVYFGNFGLRLLGEEVLVE